MVATITVKPADEFYEYLVFLEATLRHTGYALECIGALKELPEPQRTTKAKMLVLEFVKQVVLDLSLSGTLINNEKLREGAERFEDLIYEIQKEVLNDRRDS